MRDLFQKPEFRIIEPAEVRCPINGGIYTVIPMYIGLDYKELDFYCNLCYNRHVYRRTKKGVTIQSIPYRN